MPKKIYAVKKGFTKGLFYTWDTCKQAVHGYKGAEYKGFETKQEAEAYLGNSMTQTESKIVPKVTDKETSKTKSQIAPRTEKISSQDANLAQGIVQSAGLLIAYVDGSYEHSLRRYGFGCVLITPDGEIVRENGSGENEDAVLIRNIAGELLGAMFACKWGIQQGYKEIEIYHDYEGIAKWITGEWRAKNEMVQQYVNKMNQFKSHIKITFQKVKAHSNDQFNEEADQLAKEAVATGIKNRTL